MFEQNQDHQELRLFDMSHSGHGYRNWEEGRLGFERFSLWSQFSC